MFKHCGRHLVSGRLAQVLRIAYRVANLAAPMAIKIIWGGYFYNIFCDYVFLQVTYPNTQVLECGCEIF